LDEIDHVIVHNSQDLWGLSCRCSRMSVYAPLLYLMLVTRARVTWFPVLNFYCFIIYMSLVHICKVYYLLFYWSGDPWGDSQGYQ
jgi:hypothetical protein